MLIPSQKLAAVLGKPFLMLILLCLCPTLCRAIPVDDYLKRLQDAHTSIGKLVLIEDEDEAEADDYVHRVSESCAAIKGYLPEQDNVQVGQQVIAVDNSWLRKALSDIEGATDSRQRQVAIERTLERLAAISTTITEYQKATSGGLQKEDAKKRLEKILERPEYTKGPQGENALMRLLRRLLEWLAKLTPRRAPMQPGGAYTVTSAAQIIIVAIALAVILLAVVALIRKLPRRQKKIKKVREARIVLGERIEPEASSINLLADAETLARNGDIRGAIRKAYVALLVELADRHVVSLAQHKTNRDYVRSVKSIPNLHSRMLSLTDSFERHWYGYIEATPDDWQNFRTSYQAAIQTKS